ncbi:uncharacterized protein LOC133200370 [Saccostrea echinata]|uniref:uncharacterized protein LOC133200370 n=1 Tax=Saccostrea echinata TaxID=191078 RepID=UPI002A7EC822|nr:uncharacterized protein LOC133200370 [Saccostrea echinata]
MLLKKYQSDARKMERDDVNSIKNLEADFQKCYLLMQSAMDENKSILASNDPSKLLNYTSKNEKFRTIHSRFELKVPEFSLKKLTEQALCQIIGDIPETVKTSIQGQFLKAPQSNSSSEKAIKKCLDLPLTVGEINTDEEICEVACIPHTDHFYVNGFNGIIKFMKKEGKVLRRITTKTENIAGYALTVTREGHLVYIEKKKNVINKVEGNKIKCRLQVQDSWVPDAICSTYTDDLLVLVYMKSTFTFTWAQHRKVLRYSGSTFTQEIKLSDLDLDLLPIFVPCIDENKNFDIVLSKENSVLVMNNEGQFRFNYKGMIYKNFTPHGITTDSMCHILIADIGNNIIHIIDQNGQFLLYIDNCDLHNLRGLSTDSNDILYVADNHRVKRIKYME